MSKFYRTVHTQWSIHYERCSSYHIRKSQNRDVYRASFFCTKDCRTPRSSFLYDFTRTKMKSSLRFFPCESTLYGAKKVWCIDGVYAWKRSPLPRKVVPWIDCRRLVLRRKTLVQDCLSLNLYWLCRGQCRFWTLQIKGKESETMGDEWTL